MTAASPKFKEQMRELLGEATAQVLTKYILKLNSNEAEIDDLRKGAEFLVKTLGLSAEKEQHAGLATFNFVIGAPAQAVAITAGQAAQPAQVVTVEMPATLLPQAQEEISEAPPALPLTEPVDGPTEAHEAPSLPEVTLPDDEGDLARSIAELLAPLDDHPTDD